jgi:hypothetical protein
MAGFTELKMMTQLVDLSMHHLEQVEGQYIPMMINLARRRYSVRVFLQLFRKLSILHGQQFAQMEIWPEGLYPQQSVIITYGGVVEGGCHPRIYHDLINHFTHIQGPGLSKNVT